MEKKYYLFELEDDGSIHIKAENLMPADLRRFIAEFEMEKLRIISFLVKDKEFKK